MPRPRPSEAPSAKADGGYSGLGLSYEAPERYMLDPWATAKPAGTVPSRIGHNYIGRNFIGHNYKEVKEVSFGRIVVKMYDVKAAKACVHSCLHACPHTCLYACLCAGTM